MFQAILRTQWKWSWHAVALGVVAAFALPLISVQPTGAQSNYIFQTVDIMSEMSRYSPWFGGLALLLGALFATMTWASDHRGKHVYALTLPISRQRYVLMRYAAGLILLAAPLLALWIGSIVAASTAQIPAGLRSYPHALSLRFALAAILSFSILFAISSGTTRTAAYVLTALLVLGLGQVGINVFGIDENMLRMIFDRLVVWPGPFEIFTGEWKLIDV